MVESPIDKGDDIFNPLICQKHQQGKVGVEDIYGIFGEVFATIK